MDYGQSNIDAAMTPSLATSPHIVVLATLYVLVEAGHFILRTYTIQSKLDVDRGEVDRSTAMAKWKSELASQGAKGGSAVDDWVDGWFEPINARSCIKEVRRGNVEVYLSERLFGLKLNDVLADPTRHHILIGLVSELERKRNRRFPSGLNTGLRLFPIRNPGATPYRPLFFSIVAVLHRLIELSFDRSQTASVARSFGTKTRDGHDPSEKRITPESKPHVSSTVRAIPASSLAMVSSLSNLSSIGLCAAPPLRTRQRSRTIEAVIACAQIPASSLAMMSSLSNLSSIGMCAAPPLRTRQRSRTATSVVGYASAIPFTCSQKVTVAA